MSKYGAKRDLVGERFGRLVVLEMMDERDSKGNIIWKCQCDCGNIRYKTTSSLTRKRGTKSCGCYNRDMSMLKNTKNIVGKKYGLLTVVAQAPKPKNPKYKGCWWYCDCDCGTRNVLVDTGHLKAGHKKSCGCLSSMNEVKIERILKREKINYQTQYTFDDCISPETGWKLKFDFAILDDQDNLKFLIEYDGEQHFYGMRFSKNKKVRDEKNKKILMFDTIKTKYCKEHGIKLYRINFTQRNDLENVVLSILDKERKETNNGI